MGQGEEWLGFVKEIKNSVGKLLVDQQNNYKQDSLKEANTFKIQQESFQKMIYSQFETMIIREKAKENAS